MEPGIGVTRSDGQDGKRKRGGGEQSEDTALHGTIPYFWVDGLSGAANLMRLAFRVFSDVKVIPLFA